MQVSEQIDGKYNQNNQFHKAGEILTKLKPLVSAQDRKDCIKELQLSDTTIISYLKGKVSDLGTAERIIVFFSERIDRREKLFNQTLTAVTGA